MSSTIRNSKEKFSVHLITTQQITFFFLLGSNIKIEEGKKRKNLSERPSGNVNQKPCHNNANIGIFGCLKKYILFVWLCWGPKL